jgi:hypothetical protein
MIERHIQVLRVEDPGIEDLAATRERLGGRFPRGATRRMTQLGLLLGGVLEGVEPGPADAIVYASCFAESRALGEYLAGFPAPSPTLFQTSIHPSAVQQALIARQQPVGLLLPLTGRRQLVGHAVQAALAADSPRVLLCGGEERGAWSRAPGFSSPESFAFAMALTRKREGALGTLALEPCGDPCGELSLQRFFAALRDRSPLRQPMSTGMILNLTWR